MISRDVLCSLMEANREFEYVYSCIGCLYQYATTSKVILLTSTGMRPEQFGANFRNVPSGRRRIESLGFTIRQKCSLKGPFDERRGRVILGLCLVSPCFHSAIIPAFWIPPQVPEANTYAWATFTSPTYVARYTQDTHKEYWTMYSRALNK